jgi:hypothetical protein
MHGATALQEHVDTDILDRFLVFVQVLLSNSNIVYSS